MAKRTPRTPFCDDDFVYFELRSPHFRAFDLGNDGGWYSVPQFQPGVYRLAIEAIRAATAHDQEERSGQLILVDTCRIFFVDDAFVAKFRQYVDHKEAAWQHPLYFEKLREQVGVDFGHANVNSDGSYVLDLSGLERVDLRKGTHSTKARPKDDPYEKVARRMRTFVCEKCFGEELMSSGETARELAKRAKDQGWLLVPPEGKRKTWFFEAFQILGPKCAAKREKAG